jgi:Flp pilus assembly protein TadG
MNIFRCNANRYFSQQRDGAAALEAALIIPVLVVVTLMAVDIAQYINLAQQVSNASREGARIASRDSTETVSDVETAILSFFGDLYPELSSQQLSDTVLIEIRDANNQPISQGDLTSIPSGDPISVRVAFDFRVVRWLGGLNYWSGSVNDMTSISRRE